MSLLAINKDSTTNLNAQISMTGFSPSATAVVRSYGILQDEAARTNAPALAQDITTNGFSGASATLSYNFPPLSLTLFTFAPAPPNLVVFPPNQLGGDFVLQLQGQPKVRYILQNSGDLNFWTNSWTNALTSSTVSFTNPAPAGTGRQFWRALWQP